MNSIRSFGAVLFVLSGTVLSAQDHKHAPPLQVVLDQIATAPVIYGDSVLHPDTDQLKHEYNAFSGLVVDRLSDGLPLKVRAYSDGQPYGVWYELNSAGSIVAVDSFPVPGELGLRYAYWENGMIESIQPIRPIYRASLTFDRIFGGYEFGDYLYYDRAGQLSRKLTYHDDHRLEINGFYPDGQYAYHMVRGKKWATEYFWCPHGQRVGSIIIDCISGECSVRGIQYEWSTELSSYYKISYGKKRYALHRLKDGTKMTFSKRDEMEAAVQDLSLTSLFWRNEIEFEPLPCRHKR